MTIVIDSNEWSCPQCTFVQTTLITECTICGAIQPVQSVKQSSINQHIYPTPKSVDRFPKPKPKPVPKQISNPDYGHIIYQLDRFNQQQLLGASQEYSQNPNAETSTWDVFLFGDNDIDHSRPANTPRTLNGGLASVTGIYDHTICFGVVTTFYTYQARPTLAEFRGMINLQFDDLLNKYLIYGHNLIIPTPNENDLKTHAQSFYEIFNSNNYREQVVFHNIGTGIAQLPFPYLKYIQFKINGLQMISHYKKNQKSKAETAKLLMTLQYKMLPQGGNAKQVSVVSPMVKLAQSIDDIKCDGADDDAKEDLSLIRKKTTIDFCAQDLIDVCVDKNLDLWVKGIFLSNSSNGNCFVEILKSEKSENTFIELALELVRYRKDFADDNLFGDDNDNKENDAGLVIQPIQRNISVPDEWENVNDFVLTEYIRDVFAEDVDLLSNLDEFIKRMTFLGVSSATSRARCLAILEKIRNEKLSADLALKLNSEYEQNVQHNQQSSDATIALELATKIQNGHTFDFFVCIRCNLKQENGGIELRNCLHKICYQCFPSVVQQALKMETIPKCIRCAQNIHYNDINFHMDRVTADFVSELQLKEMIASNKNAHHCYDKKCDGIIIIENQYTNEFNCPTCFQRNCLKCTKIHRGAETCPPPPAPPQPIRRRKPARVDYRGTGKYPYNQNAHNPNCRGVSQNEYFTNREFFDTWANVNKDRALTMCKAFDVPKRSAEWNLVVKHIRDPRKRDVRRIQRIQNGRVWQQYMQYCQGLENKGCAVKEGGYWHGTRLCNPSVIWQGKGLEKRFSKIGNCLWFATENTYSMNGFQHKMPRANEFQVFLCLVACGDSEDVRFIRSNKILNVYADASSYPAYLLTYRNK